MCVNFKYLFCAFLCVLCGCEKKTRGDDLLLFDALFVPVPALNKISLVRAESSERVSVDAKAERVVLLTYEKPVSNYAYRCLFDAYVKSIMTALDVDGSTVKIINEQEGGMLLEIVFRGDVLLVSYRVLSDRNLELKLNVKRKR